MCLFAEICSYGSIFEWQRIKIAHDVSFFIQQRQLLVFFQITDFVVLSQFVFKHLKLVLLLSSWLQNERQVSVNVYPNCVLISQWLTYNSEKLENTSRLFNALNQCSGILMEIKLVRSMSHPHIHSPFMDVHTLRRFLIEEF